MSKLLLIHPGAMGDLIQALPAFERIRSRATADYIALLVASSFAGMARDWHLFDEVIGFDAWTAYHGSLLARGKLLWRLVGQLRDQGFDVVATLKGSPLYALLAFASGAPVRVGLTRGVGATFLTKPIRAALFVHREDRFLRVAAALGGEEMQLAVAHWPAAHKVVEMLPAHDSMVLIGIAPGGGNIKEGLGARQWPADRYAELCYRLVKRHDQTHIVLIGAPSDARIADAIIKQLPEGRFSNFIGATSVAEARSVIAACHVVVTNDCGLLHLAGTTATPIVAIFGPTDPAVVCPRRESLRAIWHPARPEPCYDSVTGKIKPCLRPCCIERCSVDEVFDFVWSSLRINNSKPSSSAAELRQDLHLRSLDQQN